MGIEKETVSGSDLKLIEKRDAHTYSKTSPHCVHYHNNISHI